MQFVVIGGGTAGLITALMVRASLPSQPVTVVRSSAVGILGAGEGTTPHFVQQFLDRVGIPVSDVVRYAGATIKNAVRFTNWRGDGQTYYHPFDDAVTKDVDLALLHPERTADSTRLNFTAHCSHAGKVLFSPKPPWERDPSADRIRHLTSHGNFALHFNAKRLAEYLERVAIERGIEFIDGLVVDLHQNERGDVDRVHLEDGRVLPSDFIFDCSGTARLVIGKLYDVRWTSHKRSLPVDRAVTFTLPHKPGPMEPVTSSIALKAGWMWHIPTQRRNGCGYVYDSDCVNDDGARQELNERYPGVELGRTLRFDAGYYERIWVNNCVAVGLSMGFLEPLEATSIWSTVMLVKELLHVYLPLNDDRARSDLNAFHRTLQERLLDFLYLHYITPRDDTVFWRTFQQRTRVPAGVKMAMAGGGLRWSFEQSHLLGGHPLPFLGASWMRVAVGVDAIDRGSFAKYWKHYNLHEGYLERLSEHERRIASYTSGCLDHRAFLAYLRREGPLDPAT
ncbi:MAG: tryptophan halogenase [Kiritimatiellia bacterium]|jgi:tryptophan halogenase